MEIFGLELLDLLIGAIIGFLVGVFVYRNNETKMDPIADKIDLKFDQLKAEIADLKRRVEEKRGI